MNMNAMQSISDEQLLADLRKAAGTERYATAQLVALLAEMDSRRLYLRDGYSSLFVYCTKCLHLSEHAAYGRIEAARTARSFPLVLEMLAEGSLTLTAVTLLAKHLTSQNHTHILNVARYKTKREIEEQVAALAPKSAIPSTVRKLRGSVPPGVSEKVADASATLEAIPSPNSAAAPIRAESTESSSARLSRRAVVAPLAPALYKVQITIGQETLTKFRRVQDLLRHSVPNGDPAVIFDRAVSVLLRELERRKLAQVDFPRESRATVERTRHVPAAIRREVWARDGGRCAFIGTTGRCAEQGFLELHHIVPFAEGGPALSTIYSYVAAHITRTKPGNISGQCCFVSGQSTMELGLDRVDCWHETRASRGAQSQST